MRVVMKHPMPGQKKKIELDLTARDEGSVCETAIIRFTGGRYRRWVTGIPVGVLSQHGRWGMIKGIQS